MTPHRAIVVAAVTALLTRAVLADQGAVVAGAAAGAAAANQPVRVPERELIGRELEDWRDPRTGTTTHLFSECGHTVEVRLSGTGAANYATVTLHNDMSVRTTISSRSILAHFDGGPTRRLEPVKDVDVILEPNWWVQWTLRFPRKSDFATSDRIVLTIPLALRGRTECEIRAVLVRDPRVPPSSATTTDYTALELYLEGGPRFWASGGQEVLSGGDGFQFCAGFGSFFAVNHGVFVDVMLESYGDEGLAALGPDVTVREGDRLGAAALWGGYIIRAYLGSWFVINYGIGIAPYIISLGDNDDSTSSTEVFYLAARQRARLDLALGRISDGSWFGLGAGINHVWVPDGSFGSAPASGHALTATAAVIGAL